LGDLTHEPGPLTELELDADRGRQHYLDVPPPRIDVPCFRWCTGWLEPRTVRSEETVEAMDTLTQEKRSHEMLRLPNSKRHYVAQILHKMGGGG
jgi:hypothetical protein